MHALDVHGSAFVYMWSVVTPLKLQQKVSVEVSSNQFTTHGILRLQQNYSWYLDISVPSFPGMPTVLAGIKVNAAVGHFSIPLT